jgi:prepilin-type N-terminal cleavage/methylation domain-containing protein
MKQPGVSLIELLIAMFIGSMLSVVLFSILNQASKSLVLVERIATTDLHIMTFYDRFERDVTGAFIPAIGDPDLADKAFAQLLKQAQSQEQGAAPGAQAEPKGAKTGSLQDIQVKKVFVYEEKENNLALFSFITDNPVAGYHQSKPRIARVTYTLKPERGAKTYTLWRKESLKLGMKKDEHAREYKLLNHIESLRLELLAPAPVEEKAAPQKSDVDEKTKAAPLKIYKSWPINESDKDSKKTSKDLPQFVKVYVRYVDALEHRATDYEFLFPISCFRAPSQSILNVPLIHQQREEQKKQLAEQQTQQEKQRVAQTKQPAAETQPAPAKTPSPVAGIAQMMVGAQDAQQRRNTVGA